MLGTSISDPENTEFSFDNKTVPGMNLLPVCTVFSGEKFTKQVSGNLPELSGNFAPLSGLEYTGYEIHMGETTINGKFPDNIFGSYIHGLFDKSEISAALAEILFKRKNISKEITTVDTVIYKEQQYDKLAELVRSNLDMKKVYETMGIIHEL
jgi:adenosylcobyric acid synthase